jgi:hypothetical protein
MASTRHGIAPEFLDVADQFVQLANSMSNRYPRAWVAAAMMYATARYNAFVWLTRESELDQSLDQAVAYYTQEYEAMLRDNVAETAPAYGAGGSSQGPAGNGESGSGELPH